jgi:hypothetical protein
MTVRNKSLISRRAILRSSAAAGGAIILPGAGCIMSTSDDPLSPADSEYNKEVVDNWEGVVNAITRPFGIVGSALATLFVWPAKFILKTQIAHAKTGREASGGAIAPKENGWAPGEGTPGDEGLHHAPALTSVYLEAVRRTGGRPKSDKLYTDVGRPYYPVVAGYTLDSQVQGQVFYNSQMGLKYLLAPADTQGTRVHPIPEHFARHYLDPKKCFGAPISDPEWSRCKHCDSLQVSQEFDFQGGIILAFDQGSEKRRECDHDRHGEPIDEECPLKVSAVGKGTCVVK